MAQTRKGQTLVPPNQACARTSRFLFERKGTCNEATCLHLTLRHFGNQISRQEHRWVACFFSDWEQPCTAATHTGRHVEAATLVHSSRICFVLVAPTMVEIKATLLSPSCPRAHAHLSVEYREHHIYIYREHFAAIVDSIVAGGLVWYHS